MGHTSRRKFLKNITVCTPWLVCELINFVLVVIRVNKTTYILSWEDGHTVYLVKYTTCTVYMYIISGKGIRVNKHPILRPYCKFTYFKI